MTIYPPSTWKPFKALNVRTHRTKSPVEFFLKEEALRLHDLQSAITRLYFDENQNLVGYFTLYNDLVSLHKRQIEKYERDFKWNSPNYRYFPAVKLHYLGVDQRYRDWAMENTCYRKRSISLTT